MNTTNDEESFRNESRDYWLGKYTTDSRGSLINDPEEYAKANRDDYRPLYDKILSYSPSSVLEVGCNACGNLNALKILDPKLKIAGIELNPKAIEIAHGYFDTKEWTLINGNALDKSTWEMLPQKYDVVYTCACLIHISPGENKRFVINKLLQAASKAVVMYESHTSGEPVLDVRKDQSHSPYCIDNYLNYGEFEVEEVEPMIDYPDKSQALICRSV